jgi:hypothetical protein
MVEEGQALAWENAMGCHSWSWFVVMVPVVGRDREELGKRRPSSIIILTPRSTSLGSVPGSQTPHFFSSSSSHPFIPRPNPSCFPKTGRLYYQNDHNAQHEDIRSSSGTSARSTGPPKTGPNRGASANNNCGLRVSSQLCIHIGKRYSVLVLVLGGIWLFILARIEIRALEKIKDQDRDSKSLCFLFLQGARVVCSVCVMHACIAVRVRDKKTKTKERKRERGGVYKEGIARTNECGAGGAEWMCNAERECRDRDRDNKKETK